MFKIMPRDGTITKSLRMPEQMVARLNELAEENNLTFTDATLQCIQYALDSLDEGK